MHLDKESLDELEVNLDTQLIVIPTSRHAHPFTLLELFEYLHGMDYEINE